MPGAANRGQRTQRDLRKGLNTSRFPNQCISCSLNTYPALTDNCSSHLSPKMLPFVTDGDLYRDPQLVKNQRSRHCGVPHPLQWSLPDKSKSLAAVLRQKVSQKLVSWRPCIPQYGCSPDLSLQQVEGVVCFLSVFYCIKSQKSWGQFYKVNLEFSLQSDMEDYITYQKKIGEFL